MTPAEKKVIEAAMAQKQKSPRLAMALADLRAEKTAKELQSTGFKDWAGPVDAVDCNGTPHYKKVIE